MKKLSYFKKIRIGAIGLLTSFCIYNASAQTDVDFNFTGDMQTFTVPAGVTSVNIDAGGGQGGSSANGSGRAGGGRIQATYAVTPGQILNIYVGGAGGDGSLNSFVGAVGGYNGGGNSGIAPLVSGGAGGGATDIRVGGTDLTNRILVAGGGGGGGTISNGGIGGEFGYAGMSEDNIIGGEGGAKFGPGLGGVGDAANGDDGSLGQGGNGAEDGSAGGGGAGYYGGGGGASDLSGNGSAGGGGANYANDTMTNVVHNDGYNKGNGYLKITYTVQTTTGLEKSTVSNFTLYPNPATDNVTVTFTESVSGTVSIVDLHGNVVAIKSISGNNTNISTADLASGVYVVKISSDKGVAVKQLVIQ